MTRPTDLAPFAVLAALLSACSGNLDTTCGGLCVAADGDVALADGGAGTSPHADGSGSSTATGDGGTKGTSSGPDGSSADATLQDSGSPDANASPGADASGAEAGYSEAEIAALRRDEVI